MAWDNNFVCFIKQKVEEEEKMMETVFFAGKIINWSLAAPVNDHKTIHGNSTIHNQYTLHQNPANNIHSTIHDDSTIHDHSFMHNHSKGLCFLEHSGSN